MSRLEWATRLEAFGDMPAGKAFALIPETVNLFNYIERRRLAAAPGNRRPLRIKGHEDTVGESLRTFSLHPTAYDQTPSNTLHLRAYSGLGSI